MRWFFNFFGKKNDKSVDLPCKFSDDENVKNSRILQENSQKLNKIHAQNSHSYTQNPQPLLSEEEKYNSDLAQSSMSVVLEFENSVNFSSQENSQNSVNFLKDLKQNLAQNSQEIHAQNQNSVNFSSNLNKIYAQNSRNSQENSQNPHKIHAQNSQKNPHFLKNIHTQKTKTQNPTKPPKFDLRHDSIYKLFFRYFIPALCAMLALSTYSTIDGIFVGQKLGENALAAVGVASPIFPVLIAYELLFAVGAATLTSYHLGRNEANKARAVFSSVFYFAFFSSLFIGLIFYANAEKLAAFLGASDTLKPLVAEYLRVICLGSAIIVLHPLLDLFAMNDKRPTLAMVAMIVGAVSHIILNYFFIFVFELGLTGSALATVLGHSIGFLILLRHFLSKKGQIYFVIAFRVKTLLKSAQNGIAQCSAELSVSIVTMVANHILAKDYGDRFVAMYSVIMYCSMVFFAFLISANQAVQPIVSFNYGAKAYKRILSLLRFALSFAFLLGAVLYVAALCLDKYLVVLFLQSGDVDSTFISECVAALSIYFAGYLFVGVNLSAASFFQAVQRPASSFIITICSTFLFVLILFFTLPPLFAKMGFGGVSGIWASYPVGEFLACCVALCVIFYELKFGALNFEHLKAKLRQKDA